MRRFIASRRFFASTFAIASLILGFTLFRPLTEQKVSAQTAVGDANGTRDANAPRDANTRLDQALREIQDLRALANSQGRRISSLERSVKALETQATTPAANRWKTPEGWAEIRVGMSRADVEYILGPPRKDEAVIDKQTLTYGTDTDVMGTVTLVDDRVSQVNAPGFKIVVPEPGK